MKSYNATADEVRGFLDGTKTQLRVPIKPQPYKVIFTKQHAMFAWDGGAVKSFGGVDGYANNADQRLVENLSPLGQVGDRIFVRETWSADGREFYPHNSVDYRADCLWVDEVENGQFWSPEGKQFFPFRWRSPVVMKQKHARIFREIARIRVERVGDIPESNTNTKTEGTKCHTDDGVIYYGPLDRGHACPISAFKNYWNSKHDKKGFGFDTNCWVWVYDLKGG